MLSLTEVRVLYELANHETMTASQLCRDLRLDPGYLSRVLRSFKGRGFIEKKTSSEDGRQNLLWLTENGSKAFAPLNQRSHDEIGELLARLSPIEQDQLVDAMSTVEEILGARPERKAPYILRPPQPGDMGWIVHRHGALYTKEYGWDEKFEGLVASIVAKFVENYDPKRERCWIAEKEGDIVGSVFLVSKSQTVGQLRLLLVEPKARGLGIGTRLVDECIRFAQLVGYRKIILWTNDVLRAAGHIYGKAGFRLIDQKKHHSFGHDLVGQIYERKL
jgi:DNA-binding MarR family transcriptional regulator/N-acetylglutamate synthase-like GNAT family acetyltransferase